MVADQNFTPHIHTYPTLPSVILHIYLPIYLYVCMYRCEFSFFLMMAVYFLINKTVSKTKTADVVLCLLFFCIYSGTFCFHLTLLILKIHFDSSHISIHTTHIYTQRVCVWMRWILKKSKLFIVTYCVYHTMLYVRINTYIHTYVCNIHFGLSLYRIFDIHWLV